MGRHFSDQEITSLLGEKKPLPDDWQKRTKMRPKRGHKERDLEIDGISGGRYRLILRESEVNPLAFSVILAVYLPGTSTLFRLRRYNGKGHEHTNLIEGETFYDFHIHTATERYQELGAREDAYAEPTERFSDLRGAVRCLIQDANLSIPKDPQGCLFEEL